MTFAHERRLQLQALAGAAPALVLAGTLLALSPWPAWIRWSLGLGVAGALAAGLAALRERARRPLQTLANLLTALREGDFSFRGREHGPGALGIAFQELNTLADLLQAQRIGALEATALLRTVIEEVEVALFAFDAEGRLRLLNRAGEALLAQPKARALGETARALGLSEALDGEALLMDLAFPGGSGRYELRRGTFRQGGLPHRLLMLSDLTRTLRQQEREAWQRLIRVLSHEINNSLAPIQSLADSLATLAQRTPPPADLQADLLQGLGIIASRSGGLQRFLAAYTQLAKLPPPVRRPLDLGTWARRIARLETRAPLVVEGGPELQLQADGDQLDQLLINLLKNAGEACQETGGGVRLRWMRVGDRAQLEVLDEGPGLPPAANLFVPFFTTKPGGTGIGLALSRQIAEAHGGTLTLENRRPGPGAVARLSLPLA